MKTIIIMQLMILSFSLSAQTTLSTAVDFDAVDVNGNSWHLFHLLDNGNYVLLDFFYDT